MKKVKKKEKSVKNPYKNANLLAKAQRKASKIGKKVAVSTRKFKKLDVFDKSNKKVGSIGDVRYKDFNITGDKERRKLYKIRHNKTRNKVGTNSYYADKILW
tara:strand:- start:147 stop:452 length:306 start_codon:yes stop_codon:yes gene_type:complete